MCMRLLIKILVVVGLFCSCGNNSFYNENHTFGDSHWNLKDTIRFSVKMSDVNPAYNIYLTVRNTSKYESMNMWVYVDCISPKGIVVRDTINCFLADKRGYWLGRSVGELYATKHYLKRNILFEENGNYEFSIIHAMRTDDLKGINDIGISIEKLENK